MAGIKITCNIQNQELPLCRNKLNITELIGNKEERNKSRNSLGHSTERS